MRNCESGDGRHCHQEIRTCQETIAGYESEINRLQQEITEMRANRSGMDRALTTEQSRLESLKNMTERYEGYGNSIRRVMEQKSRGRRGF
ncbi:MAG: hypothetical protein ACLUUO_14465 [Sellimonas intestinalis]